MGGDRLYLRMLPGVAELDLSIYEIILRYCRSRELFNRSPRRQRCLPEQKKTRQISHHSSQFQFQKFIVTKKFHRGFRDIYDGYLFTEKVFAPDGDANLFEMVLAQDTYRN